MFTYYARDAIVLWNYIQRSLIRPREWSLESLGNLPLRRLLFDLISVIVYFGVMGIVSHYMGVPVTMSLPIIACLVTAIHFVRTAVCNTDDETSGWSGRKRPVLRRASSHEQVEQMPLAERSRLLSPWP